jgi:membrane protein DedA with SNARE-associated domain
VQGGFVLAIDLSTFIEHYGLVAVFVLSLLESACIPIPSEFVVPPAGFLAYQHSLPLWGVIAAATIANVFGGWIAYLVGRTGGRAFIQRYGRYVLLNTHHLERAEAWFAHRGEATVFIARLLPAFRTFISLPAGVARMSMPKFLFYSLLGSLPWNLALAFAGFELGAHWTDVGDYLKPLSYVAGLLFIAAIAWFWFGHRR